ncbi:dynamin family protein [Paenibacillus sp. NRS-1760]|uniref:dynamin family protein n=1 Tax=Paenibacillus sp. NRS-1760 TaxID=3233902 RepID=UPI003D298E0A
MIGTSNYKLEMFLAKRDLGKHPVLNQFYSTKMAYLSFLFAGLRTGRRDEHQIRDIMSAYYLNFGIKEKDINQLNNIEYQDETELFNCLLQQLGFTDLRKLKFKNSYCSRLLLGEILFFDLKDSNEFQHNGFIHLLADYFEIPMTYVEKVKSILVKIASNEDVNGLLKPKKMESFKYFNDCMKGYRKHQLVNGINITVIATMSSGKSTLLNALIGKKIFPSENKACTSKYLKFTNNAKLSREAGLATGKYLDSRWNITYNDIRRWNLDSEIDRIEIEGMMNPYSMLRKTKISLIDTPGTNNSRDKQHGVVTREILLQRNSDVILYILNSTNLASNDDSDLLKEVVRQLGNTKIIFLLNKTDQLDLDADDDIVDSLSIARDYVMEHGIVSPTIIPISSYAAGLYRYILDGRSLTNKEKSDALALLKLFKNPKYDMNKYIDKKLIKSLSQPAINVRTNKNIQIDSEYLSSKVIYETMKKTGIYVLESLLFQISNIPQNGR